MYSLPEALFITTIISIISYAILLVIKLKKHKRLNFDRELFLFCFIFVFSFIISMTIIPKIEISPDNSLSILKPYSHSNRINLIPFAFIKEIKFSLENGLYYNILFNFIGNIIPFSALSFLCALLFNKYVNLKNILLLGFSFSLMIELLQIPLYRGCDIDDLILNILGYAFGYLLSKIIITNYQLFINKIKEEGQNQ